MLYLLILGLGLVTLLLPLLKKKKHTDYLQEANQTVFVDSMVSDQRAVNLKSLSKRNFGQLVQQKWLNLIAQLGDKAIPKLTTYLVILLFVGFQINTRFVHGNLLTVEIIVVLAGLTFGSRWLKKREQKRFEESFPEALNMLTSAVSAGESIMHAIIFVGKSLDGDVGKEFKVMGERLQLGESSDEVFRKSCRRFPYSSFQFFIITLRANMSRGGQLKEVMSRLNRLMFTARATEKKKKAMTGEARMSAKIVGAIPFVFLFMLQFLSPENYDFVMFDPGGRPILYYVLISEFIGISIILLLMRGVK
jgi:tight adherence protein B